MATKMSQDNIMMAFELVGFTPCNGIRRYSQLAKHTVPSVRIKPLQSLLAAPVIIGD